MSGSHTSHLFSSSLFFIFSRFYLRKTHNHVDSNRDQQDRWVFPVIRIVFPWLIEFFMILRQAIREFPNQRLKFTRRQRKTDNTS